MLVALKTNNAIKDAQGTITFEGKIINFWKIVNCKGIYADVRSRDPERAPIRSPDDPRLDYLLEIARMADAMKASGKRYKRLTRDTALAPTCRGFVGLVIHLLSTTHEYVLLGIFTTDYLEKMFGKLSEGSGGTYFINVQQVLKKWSIHKTKLLLTLNVDVSSLNYLSGHSCTNCNGRITNFVQRIILHIMCHSKCTHKKCDVACSSKLLIFTISLLPQNVPFYLFLFA